MKENGFPLIFSKFFLSALRQCTFLFTFWKQLASSRGRDGSWVASWGTWHVFQSFVPKAIFFLGSHSQKNFRHNPSVWNYSDFLHFLCTKRAKNQKMYCWKPTARFYLEFLSECRKKYICSAPVHLQRFRSRPGTGVSNRRSTNV